MDAYRYVPPLAANFPNVYGTNSVNPTVTDTTGRGLVLDFGLTPAAGDNVRGITKAKPSASSYSMILRSMICPGLSFNSWIGGLMVSDGTKFVTFGHATGTSGVPQLRITKWNTKTSINADTFSVNPVPFQYEWLRWDVVSGDPKKFYVSMNGTDWIDFIEISHSGFLTHTEVGLCAHVNNPGFPAAAAGNFLTQSILYYSDPDIVPVV